LVDFTYFLTDFVKFDLQYTLWFCTKIQINAIKFTPVLFSLFLYSCALIFKTYFKVYIIWEGHKIWRNLHQLFVVCTASQIIGGDFVKICGLLRIYELYSCYIWNVLIFPYDFSKFDYLALKLFLNSGFFLLLRVYLWTDIKNSPIISAWDSSYKFCKVLKMSPWTCDNQVIHIHYIHVVIYIVNYTLYIVNEFACNNYDNFTHQR